MEQQHISKILESQFPKRSVKEALETYSHIELTEEEMDEALLWRKQKKDAELRQAEAQRKTEENRRALTGMRWSYEQTKAFMIYRAQNVFEGKFSLDERNRPIFELLCYYFSEDPAFEGMAEALGIIHPSLTKGIFLAGNFGVGKTWLMKLFMRNQRQVYHVKNAKQIADDFEAEGEEAMAEYLNKPKNAFNDASVFYQPFAGLCIDDLGTEDIKTHFGNKKNVVGDLIEKRYSKGNTGVFLHATTNLKSDQIEAFYGGRVRSRMREIFNFIELTGSDRRK